MTYLGIRITIKISVQEWACIIDFKELIQPCFEIFGILYMENAGTVHDTTFFETASTKSGVFQQNCASIFTLSKLPNQNFFKSLSVLRKEESPPPPRCWGPQGFPDIPAPVG